MAPSKSLGRTSEGLTAFSILLLSSSEGSFVSDIIITSIWVDIASSASSARFPLILLALKDPTLKLFFFGGHGLDLDRFLLLVLVLLDAVEDVIRLVLF